MKKTGVCIVLAAVLCILLTAGIYQGVIDAQTAGRAVTIAAVVGLCAAAVRRFPERALNGHRKFDRVTADEYRSDVTFADVAANQEALDSLRELADYLNGPDRYIRMGARMPRGVLLYGPPGTGKTLLARALAGEAGVPFYSLSGSDFVQMYVGVGAGRVRDLFQKARKAQRCVIFIDEIDSMGKKRGESSSDEREQTLNALLSEMSGMKETDGILVLAATNRLDTLDPALTRPGRFDRQIEVGLPGRDERLDILKLHSRKKRISPDVNLDSLAVDTVRFSGASLESLMNEAAVCAVRRGADWIEQQDVDKAYYTAVAGADRPASASGEELAVVALHEAGHAIASICLLPENRLTRISILPSSHGAAGYNLSIPQERTLMDRNLLCAQIQVLLAGRAAEMLIHGEAVVTSGASNDLSRAAEIASAMIMDLGMAGESAVALRALSKYCGVNAPDGLAAARELLQQQMSAVSELLEQRSAELMLLTERLLERESLNSEEIKALLPALFQEYSAA